MESVTSMESRHFVTFFSMGINFGYLFRHFLVIYSRDSALVTEKISKNCNQGGVCNQGGYFQYLSKMAEKWENWSKMVK